MLWLRIYREIAKIVSLLLELIFIATLCFQKFVKYIGVRYYSLTVFFANSYDIHVLIYVSDVARRLGRRAVESNTLSSNTSLILAG